MALAQRASSQDVDELDAAVSNPRQGSRTCRPPSRAAPRPRRGGVHLARGRGRRPDRAGARAGTRPGPPPLATCFVVTTAGPEPRVVCPEEASGPAPNPFDIPRKVKVVIVLVDPKKVALGQRYVAEARRMAPKVRINCVLEVTRSKDPVGVDLFRRALLASGATQVSLGPWFTWLSDDGVVASMAKDSSVEVVTDFSRNFCNVVGPSFKESTEGSDVCYSLAIQSA